MLNDEELKEIHDIDPALGEQQLKFLTQHCILKSLEQGRQKYLNKAPPRHNALENLHTNILRDAMCPFGRKALKVVSHSNEQTKESLRPSLEMMNIRQMKS